MRKQKDWGIVSYNPSDENQRFSPPPLTQGRLSGDPPYNNCPLSIVNCPLKNRPGYSQDGETPCQRGLYKKAKIMYNDANPFAYGFIIP